MPLRRPPRGVPYLPSMPPAHPAGASFPVGQEPPVPITEPGLRRNVILSPIEWLKNVIHNVTGQEPMVVHTQASPTAGSYIISLAIDSAGMREQITGERVIVHVNSIIAEQSHVAACDAVRKALAQIERQTNHIFPDYSYWKIIAFENDVQDVRQMPKSIAPVYQSPIVCP